MANGHHKRWPRIRKYIPLIFKAIIAPLSLRDAGVAGSNPAVPTTIKTRGYAKKHNPFFLTCWYNKLYQHVREDSFSQLSSAGLICRFVMINKKIAGNNCILIDMNHASLQRVSSMQHNGLDEG